MLPRKTQIAMVEVKEVTTRRMRREFLEFPNKLYKGNPYYVPPLYIDEKKIFSNNYTYFDTCEAVYYNAYKEGRMAGRISGIIQRAHNEKTGEKRVRFTRFDVINDEEVAKALFDKVEAWAISKGMETVCGPLGFSDLEREGLLIEGFDQLSTFEEQYNAEYYQHFIEKFGYKKEVEWLEFKVFAPEEYDGELDKLTNFVLKRYNLRFGQSRNVKHFLNQYADGFFKILDESYKDIYGTVPFTEKMKKVTIANFKLIINLRHVAVIVDENNEVVLLGICFPSIAKAMQTAGGHLTPLALIRLLKAIRKPEVIDLGLIGVNPEYANKGVSTAVASSLVHMLQQPGVKYAETNLNLEDNYAILNLWSRFKTEQHKKRRAYIKHLNG